MAQSTANAAVDNRTFIHVHEYSLFMYMNTVRQGLKAQQKATDNPAAWAFEDLVRDVP